LLGNDEQFLLRALGESWLHEQQEATAVIRQTSQ
jgi:hypothetical protein